MKYTKNKKLSKILCKKTYITLIKLYICLILVRLRRFTYWAEIVIIFFTIDRFRGVLEESN